MIPRQKILIVDDRPENLMALEQTLTAVDADLIRADSGNAALTACLNHEFALAILDVQMPGMDGYELAGLLREDPGTIRMPVMFLTAAFPDEQRIGMGYEAGAVDYIVKPYNPEIMISKANVFLQLGRQRAELRLHRDSLQSLVDEATQEAHATAHELQQRVKALTCLHAASRLMVPQGLPEYVMIEGLLRILPPAFQYPDITAVEIVIDERAWRTDSYHETKWGMTARLKCSRGVVGAMSVRYLEERPAVDHGPFLATERDLFDSLARDLGATLDRAQQDRDIAIKGRIRHAFLTVPDDTVFNDVLAVVLDALGSSHGLFGFVDENGDLVAPLPTGQRGDDTEGESKAVRFPHDSRGDGTWPLAIREKRTILCNEASSLPREGHPPITRHISLPIVLQDEVIGLLQVANKATDYLPRDVRLLEVIGESVAPVLGARLLRSQAEQARIRREQELIQLNLELDERVKQRTVELTAANSELEAFSYSVSHDLRAPLRALDGFSRALLEEYRERLDDRGAHYLDRSTAAARRMSEMIEALLSLSRIARRDITPVRVDLSRLGLEVIAQLREETPGWEVDTVVAPGLEAPGDPDLLRQVLWNLLDNAWKYTATTVAPRVELGVTTSGGEDAFFVRDNGVGFDMSHATDAFVPFQRLHAAAEFPGSGIGLATVQRIIKRHGGKLWAEARINEGATFFFSIEPGCTER